MQIIKILRGNQRNLNVVNIHLLLLDQVQQQVQRPLIHGYLYFVRRLRRGSLRLVLRAHLRVLLRHLISRCRHSFSLVAAGLSPQFPSSSSPTQTPLLSPVPWYPAPLFAPCSNRRRESPARASNAFRNPRAARAPAQST